MLILKKDNTKPKLTLHLKELKKEEKSKPKASKRKERMKIRTEINEIEN